MLNNIPDAAKHVADVGSHFTILGLCLTEALPPIVAGLSIIWLTLQIGNFVYTKFLKKK